MKPLVVVDTNIFFQALYNPESKQMALLYKAIEGKIVLCSPDTVKEELRRSFKKLDFPKSEIEIIMDSLPVKWIDYESYKDQIINAGKIMSHKADIPVVATALLLDVGILSSDKDFNRKDLKKRIKVWDLDELLKELKSQQ